MILKDLSIVVNSVDLSSSLRALTNSEGNNMQEAAAHGDNWESFERGLQTGVLTADFWQDFTSGGVDDTISGLLSTDSFTVVVKPTSGSVSSSNPSFTATMAIDQYDRFTGQQVGERALTSVVFALAADTGFVRAES